QAREELSINKDTGLVLFVGSGFERKGLNTLLRAISLMSGSNIKGNKNNPPSPPFSKGGMGGFEDLKLLVIGKGNIKKFQSIAKKYGINDRVLFLGPQKEIEKFYAAADIFALPTIYDPFSNATLEAMASGLPVITTKNNGVSEIIQDGEEGFAIENPLDYNMLSEKIKSALAEHESMGRKARLRAEKFPIEKAAEKFIKIIVTIVSKG
ncbi:MAG: glycosyltransferase family 4 protein, partial [Thermodesulfovibrionales bacterium]|nr:glycosyltransferase family 4 protein [Thermodesulfovibrionales bacterium]